MGDIPAVQPELIVANNFKVLISHNWDHKEADETLDAFVEALAMKLRKLPAKYNQYFSVELLYDRMGAMHPHASYGDQIDPLCDKSDMAVFIMSNGWPLSSACRQEAANFEARGMKDGKLPFFAVQLCDRRHELPDAYSKLPSYPEHVAREFDGSSNLLEIWEAPISKRDRFVAVIRDAICDYLMTLEGPRTPPSGPGSKGANRRLAREQLRQATFSPDVPEDKRISNYLTADIGDDSKIIDEKGLPAVDTIVDWSADPDAQSRLLVLLGGFGMGKTTTVQLVHEALRTKMEHGDGPTPIYLDFRRLIPTAEEGKPLNASLSDIIHATLHSDVAAKIGGKDVIDLIRNTSCLVIFDGLDEIGNKIGRDYAAQLYRQFLDLIPASASALEAKGEPPDWQACPTRLILTCRTHFFRSLKEQNALLNGSHRRASLSSHKHGNGFLTYYMAPLRPDQIKSLFLNHLGPDLGNKTFALIQTIHDLPGLATRPIMARFISEVAGQLVELHSAGSTINIATIYEELFEQGLARDAEKRPLLNTQDRRELLISLAEHLHCEGLGAQPADSLEKWFDRFALNHDGIKLLLAGSSTRTRDLLHTELENASFLVRGSDDVFSFAHTSYYEYFLAEAITNAPDDTDFARFAKRPMSAETYEFIAAIAQRDDREAFTIQRWQKVLCSDAEITLRKLAFDILSNLRAEVFPQGANLSDFDLRKFEFSKGQLLRQIDFTGAQLNGIEMSNVSFENCQMDQANFANAVLDRVCISNAIGTPVGLLSARGDQAILPEDWRQLIQNRDAYWLDQKTYRGSHIATTLKVTSVAFSPDGTRVLTGSNDRSARLWDAATGAQKIALFALPDSLAVLGQDMRVQQNGANFWKYVN